MMETGMPRDPSRESGFALLEVIVAVAIVAIALATIYRTIADAFRAASRVQAQQATVILARSQLDALGSDGQIAPGTSTGAYRNGIRWRLDVADLSGKTVAVNAARPYWVTLVTLDASGRPMFKLETAKIAREAQP